MVAREHSDTPHSGRVVYWNSHESVKCPVGADAWHARFGHGKVLASRGWTRLVEFYDWHVFETRFGRLRLPRRRCESIDVRDLAGSPTH